MPDRAGDRVEFLDTDPHAFGRTATERPPPTTTGRRRSLVAVAALAAAAALVAVVTWWSQPTSEPVSLPTTAVVVATTSSAAVPSGRDAPEPGTGLAFELEVRPTTVLVGSTLTMQLGGDLSGVSARVAAVAWLDRLAAGEWRTVYWMARTSAVAQAVRAVSGDHPESGPDAVTVAADEPIAFVADSLATGSYRLCRYVSLRGGETTRPETTRPETTNPAYVCAPLVVAD